MASCSAYNTLKMLSYGRVRLNVTWLFTTYYLTVSQSLCPGHITSNPAPAGSSANQLWLQMTMVGSTLNPGVRSQVTFSDTASSYLPPLASPCHPLS